MCPDCATWRCPLCDGQEEVLVMPAVVTSDQQRLRELSFEPYRGQVSVRPGTKIRKCPACEGVGALTDAESGAFRLGGYQAVRELRGLRRFDPDVVYR